MNFDFSYKKTVAQTVGISQTNMKPLQSLCLAGALALASFQANAELSPAQLLGTLLKAIPPQQQAGPAKPEPATGAGAVAAQPQAAPATQNVDWTPLLKAWEKGCSGNPTLDAFLIGLSDDKVVLPSPYKEGVGKLSRSTKSGEVTTRLAMSGTYYGLPVKAFERYGVKDTGIVVDSLILAVSKTVAQKALRKVAYRPDPEADFKAMVSSRGQDAVVVCDRSM